MASYLNQFNYQFLRGGGAQFQESDLQDSGLRRFVFLHGLMGYGLNWRRIATGLESHDLSLIFDQRGHGKSWKPLTGYAPEDFADDLEIIATEIGWDQFILVGHSMGGRNALMYASKFPERVKKLVIEDIGPEGDPQAPLYYEKLFASIPTPFANKKEAKEFFMNEFPKLPVASQNVGTLGQYLYSNLIEDEQGRADWRFSCEAMILAVRQGRAKDHWNELRRLSMPTLVLRGETSKELSQEVFERMQVANPLIRGKLVPNAGHWIHSDQPQAFIQILLDFARN